MSWRDNPYSSPEKFGLTIVADIDDPDSCYSFDMLIVWKHEDGRFFYAQDAGCSCPSPFEDLEKLDDLTLLTEETWSDFEAELNAWCGQDYHRAKAEAQMLRTELMRDVARAMQAGTRHD